MNKKWWKEAVIWQVWPRSFCDSNGDGIGDIRGIISKLDYLKEMGADAIWLSSVVESPNADGGYDSTNQRAIDKTQGTMADWEEMLDGIHKRGMKLIVDAILKYTSDEHPWFVESRSSRDNEKRDYYVWKDAKNGQEPNNWEGLFYGSAWEWDEKTKQYYYHIFDAKQPDLNWDNPKVRKEIYDYMKFWLDKGADGFRVDVANGFLAKEGFPDIPGESSLEGYRYLPSSEYAMNQPGIHKYIKEMNKEVFSKYENIVTIGEAPCTLEQGLQLATEDRNEYDSLIGFEHIKDTRVGRKKNDLDHMSVNTSELKQRGEVRWNLVDFKQTITKWIFGFKDRGWNTWYFDNHDQARMVSRFGNDQEYRVESAKMLATMLLTLRGTPLVYQGSEIGMVNTMHTSIDEFKDCYSLAYYKKMIKPDRSNEQEILDTLNYSARDHARNPVQWNSTENAGFTIGTPWFGVNPNYKEVNVEQALSDDNSILNYYKELISFRKKNLVLVYGEYIPIMEEDEQIFSYIRELEDERILVMLNFFGTTAPYKLPDDVKFTQKKLVISNYVVSGGAEISEITLRPYEARIYRLY